MEIITFEYLMSHRNIDKEIYHCDVDRFLGGGVGLKQREEVHKALMKIVEGGSKNGKI
jgi:hypothetical protein